MDLESGSEQSIGESMSFRSRVAFPAVVAWKPPQAIKPDDIELFAQLKMLEYTRDEDLTNCAVSILGVVERIQDSEYFLVTGKSRELARRLLLATGLVDDSQIIKFDSNRNTSVYKVLSKEGNQDFSLRVQAAREGLEERGVVLNRDGIKVSVVEEQISSGGKAAEYLKVFDSIDEVDFQYASFTTPGIFEIGTHADQVAKFGEDGVSRLVFPEAGIMTDRSSTILHTLSRLASRLHEENESDRYSREAKKTVGSMTESVLERLVKEIGIVAANR